jgi:hypothetical protein
VELDQIVFFIQSLVDLYTPGDPILFYNSLIEYRNLPLGRDTHRVNVFHFFCPTAVRVKSWRRESLAFGKLFVAMIHLPCRVTSTRENTGAQFLVACATEKSMLFVYSSVYFSAWLPNCLWPLCSTTSRRFNSFVLGLWTSSDVFRCFRLLIVATGRRMLRGKP